MRVHFLLLSFALIAAAPSSGLRELAAADARVAAIGHRLAVANTALCREVVNRPGLIVHDITQYAPQLRAAARSELGLGDRPTVLAVVQESDARRAGLFGGDIIMAIDGVAVQPGSADRASYATVARVSGDLARAMTDPPATVSVYRKNRAVEVPLHGDAGCASRFELVPGGKLNASADGRVVQISAKLLEFAGSEDAVAMALAHELAHNALGHPALLKARGRSAKNVRLTEEEADRLGLYMVARAGYDLNAAADFLARYAKRSDWGPLSDGTHPSAKARRTAALATIAEIEAKRRAGLPLVP